MAEMASRRLLDFWLCERKQTLYFRSPQPETLFVSQMFVPENGRHGNALAVSFLRRRVRLRSRTYHFHCSIEKRCGKLGHYVSFTEIHVHDHGKFHL